ncbi:MAG TPA: tetratricopeptide repeat protein, partial [Burkholderiales bacterium]|nr:tetratricopeptide repeat protein [Burkholderiales bacterium]
MSAATLREAEQARLAGDLDAAMAACQGILARLPEDPAALNLIAAVAADQGRIEEGLGWAARAALADSRAAGPHYTMGRLFEMQQRLGEAEASYRRAIELAPRDARAHNNL